MSWHDEVQRDGAIRHVIDPCRRNDQNDGWKGSGVTIGFEMLYEAIGVLVDALGEEETLKAMKRMHKPRIPSEVPPGV